VTREGCGSGTREAFLAKGVNGFTAPMMKHPSLGSCSPVDLERVEVSPGEDGPGAIWSGWRG